MKYIRPPHLIATFLEDGRLLIKDSTLGVAAKVPPFAASIFSVCSTPQSREDILRKFAQQGASFFDQLIDIGLLITPEQASKEQMFSNFAHISVHRTMLSDEIRLSAYQKALQAVITPESIVIDAGSGTGALAVYAALAGAKHVYAVENSDLHQYIHHVAQDSGVGDRITVINSNFAELRLKEKADILVTETFGAWALAEGAAADLAQCITHNLKPDGLWLPEKVDLWMSPLDILPTEILYPFRSREDGLNLSFFQRYAQQRSANICTAVTNLAIHIAQLSLIENTISGSFTLAKSCAGLLLWFDLLFPRSVVLSTHPEHPQTHWKQTVLAASLSAGTHSFVGYPAEDDPRSYILRIQNQEYRIR